MKKMICLLLALLVTLPLCACSDTSTTANNSSSNSSTESYYGTEDLIGGGHKPYIPPSITLQNLAQESTHIVYAICRPYGVKVKEDTVIFDFSVFKVLKGELEQDPLLKDGRICQIEVKGSVREYALDNVFSPGTAYVLWLQEHKDIEEVNSSTVEDVWYDDICPVPVDKFRFSEPWETRIGGKQGGYDAYIDEIMTEEFNAVNLIKDVEELMSQE